MKKELSYIIKIIIGIVIFRHIVNIVQTFIYMSMDGDNLFYVNLAQSIIMIIILSFILMKKKWAVCAFFIFQLLNAFIVSGIKPGNFAYNLSGDIVVSFFMMALMAGILFIKNNGLSGWEIIFGKIEFKAKNKKEKIIEIPKDCSNLVIDKEEIETSSNPVSHAEEIKIKENPASSISKEEPIINNENKSLNNIVNKRFSLKNISNKVLLYIGIGVLLAIGGFFAYSNMNSHSWGDYIYYETGGSSRNPMVHSTMSCKYIKNSIIPEKVDGKPHVSNIGFCSKCCTEEMVKMATEEN